MKKFLAIMLALVLALGMTSVAFAETGSIQNNDKGTINITNAEAGETYAIYEIFQLQSYDTTNGTYAYKVVNAWKNFVEEQGIELDADGYITDSAALTDAAAFAKAALIYAQTNNISPASTQMATSTTVTFSNLELGYYLVDTTLGTLCSLDSTDKTVDITEKNPTATVVKTVKEDSANTYGVANDDDMTSAVYFQTVISDAADASDLVLHDVMGDGLTFDDTSVVVTVSDTSVPASTTVDGNTVTNWTLTTNNEDECTFEIAFTDAYLASIVDEATITVTYTATLNNNAVVAGAGNKNETWVTYGQAGESAKDTTLTYTWELPLMKYANPAEGEIALAGATFTLSKHSNGSTPYSLIKCASETINDVVVDVYEVVAAGTTNAVTEITTPESGKIVIRGLDADTYYLTETKAPDGYNKLTAPITVVIASTVNEQAGTMTATTTVGNATVSEVKVLNQTGSELPSTGGMGTTIFYVVGGMMMAAAFVLLITKRKVAAGK